MIIVTIESRTEAILIFGAKEVVSGPQGVPGPSAGEGIDPDLVLIYTVAKET